MWHVSHTHRRDCFWQSRLCSFAAGPEAAMRGIRLPQRGLSEGEIRQCIEAGGRLRNVLILARGTGPDVEHLAYIRPSWRRGFLPLRTWGDKGDRTYKDVDRLLALLRDDFGFAGVIALYVEGDPDVRRYRALADRTPKDRSILSIMEADGPDPTTTEPEPGTGTDAD